MQDIIVLIIVVATFGYVGWIVFKSITEKPNMSERCGGCSGCDLKRETNCKENG